MFGANALKRNMPLNLIINMVALDGDNSVNFDRLGNNLNTRNILGLPFTEVTLPAAPGRSPIR